MSLPLVSLDGVRNGASLHSFLRLHLCPVYLFLVSLEPSYSTVVLTCHGLTLN